jgi:hypothetical protein
VYSQGPNAAAQAVPKYRTFNPSANAISSEATLSSLGAAAASLETVKLVSNYRNNEIMALMGASDQDLWTIVWDGENNGFYSSGGRGQIEHGLSGSFDEDFWFDFVWD